MMVLGLLNISVTGKAPFFCFAVSIFSCIVGSHSPPPSFVNRIKDLHAMAPPTTTQPAFLDYFAPSQPPPHYSSLPLDVFLDGSWIATRRTPLWSIC
jgi:hypothetical protein